MKKIDMTPDEMTKQLSRREFLKKTGLSAVSVAVAGSALASLTSCEEKYVTSYPEKQELAYTYVASSQDAAPYPYPYQKLDATTCAERAYAAYQQKGG